VREIERERSREREYRTIIGNQRESISSNTSQAVSIALDSQLIERERERETERNRQRESER
jgi:hypothetical protein